MDELKILIDKNRQLLDSAEPMEGHFDKFEKMLNEQLPTVKNRSVIWPTILKVASVAILVVLSGLYVTEHFFLQKIPTAYQNTEFNEAQQYYIQQVDMRIDEIKQMENMLSPEQKEILVDEMTQMDAMYEKLKNDYKAMPNDPRIIQAMLQHYQMKMDILNRIVNNLQNVQQLNYTNHENIEL